MKSKYGSLIFILVVLAITVILLNTPMDTTNRYPAVIMSVGEKDIQAQVGDEQMITVHTRRAKDYYVGETIIIEKDIMLMGSDRYKIKK